MDRINIKIMICIFLAANALSMQGMWTYKRVPRQQVTSMPGEVVRTRQSSMQPTWNYRPDQMPKGQVTAVEPAVETPSMWNRFTSWLNSKPQLAQPQLAEEVRPTMGPKSVPQLEEEARNLGREQMTLRKALNTTTVPKDFYDMKREDEVLTYKLNPIREQIRVARGRNVISPESNPTITANELYNLDAKGRYLVDKLARLQGELGRTRNTRDYWDIQREINQVDAELQQVDATMRTDKPLLKRTFGPQVSE